MQFPLYSSRATLFRLNSKFYKGFRSLIILLLLILPPIEWVVFPISIAFITILALSLLLILMAISSRISLDFAYDIKGILVTVCIVKPKTILIPWQSIKSLKIQIQKTGLLENHILLQINGMSGMSIKFNLPDKDLFIEGIYQLLFQAEKSHLSLPRFDFAQKA